MEWLESQECFVASVTSDAGNEALDHTGHVAGLHARIHRRDDQERGAERDEQVSPQAPRACESARAAVR